MSALTRAGRRILQLLGLVLEEVCEPVTDPAPAQPDHEWCNDLLTLDRTDHVCDLELGHTGPEHECGCGHRWPTARVVERILRAVRLSAHYDSCLWPKDGVCPLHDAGAPWPAGRDCLGTCTSCNATTLDWHAPSCPHYNPTTEETELRSLAQWRQQQLRHLHGKA